MTQSRNETLGPDATVPLLELDLLRTLVAIAETGNFSAAAKVVNRTPSAVSMQVKRLEELVGKPVFRRDARSVSTTPAGEILLEHGRRVLALNRDMVTKLIAPDIVGSVRLGAPDDIAERSLPDMLRRFSRSHCGVVVDVVVEGSDSLVKRVKQGELDLALVTCNPYEELPDNHEIVLRERLTWAGAKNGVAHEQKPLPVSVWDAACSWRNAGLDSLDESGQEYRIAMMSAHTSGQRAAILADMAIAPVPVSACHGGIVELGIKEGFPALRDYALALVIGSDSAPPVLAAAQHLRDALKSQSPFGQD